MKNRTYTATDCLQEIRTDQLGTNKEIRLEINTDESS
jgi:hypothetical protein